MTGVRHTPRNLRAGRSVDRRVDLDLRRRTRRAPRGAGVAAALTFAAVLPDRVGVGHLFPLAAVAALRPHATAAALAASALLAGRPRTRPLAAGVGSAALVGAASLLGRARRAQGERRRETTDLIVLAANVLVGSADTGALATLLEREQPDLVCLPEAGPDYRDKLYPLVAALGYRAWASTAPGTSDGEGVVHAASL